MNPEPGADVVQSNLFPVCDEIMALGLDRHAEVHQYVQHEEYIDSPNKNVEYRRAMVVVCDREGRLFVISSRRKVHVRTTHAYQAKTGRETG